MTAESPPTMQIDMQKMDSFMGLIMGHMSGAVVSFMCSLGDRLNLFKVLAGSGPITSAELAARAQIDARYAREWLSTLASAGYLEYDPSSRRFTLPPEHAMVLAAEGAPMFMGGAYQQLPALLGPLDAVANAFRTGGGVAQEAYDANLWAGMERISAGWFDNLLVQQWIAALPDVQARLTSGGRVADIGSGGGRALIRLAQAFPHSRFVGYDTFQPAVERAAANAEAAGVADRVRFENRDAAAGLPEQYDLITTFDVVHDLVDPLAVLQAIRQSLTPGGTYLLLEMNGSDKLEENAGPIGTILYGTSVMYCTPTAIANGGEGLGTLGLPEPKVRQLCAEAGFRTVRRVPIQNPFNILYEVKP